MSFYGQIYKKKREPHPFGWKNNTHFYTLDETLRIFYVTSL